MNNKSPSLTELTIRSIILAIILTVILAAANAYLALKLGILTSASIPAAVISMGILRFFKNPSILENNAVQTAASAGEAVAGGIVYTIPALIVIGYWSGFDYWTNVFIALTGGVLGVLFSIPLRRILVHDDRLKFPEGRAIAEVLKTSNENADMRDIFVGGFIGAILEFLQSGFQILAASWNYWFVVRDAIFSFGAGFSATMLGAGYLIGPTMSLSIFIGAILSWVFVLPITSLHYPEFIQNNAVEHAGSLLWNTKLRYVGIGAMLFAGLWTFMQLVKPLIKSMRHSLGQLLSNQSREEVPRTEKDIGIVYILGGVIITAIFLFFFLQQLFPLEQSNLLNYSSTIVVGAVIYILIIGFLFSIVTAYFSGMVGVTASPGSSVVIAGMLFAAYLILVFMNQVLPLPFSPEQIKAAEAITIIIGSVVTGIAAIANDNTQDLKVGQLVGATPWKQQIMLLLGVLISALVIPPIMQILFDVYGIAGVMPRADMDISMSLPAPAAALMAAVTEAVFNRLLPANMLCIGALIIFALIIFTYVFKLNKKIALSIMGVAVGMYLPLSTSFPLFLGGMIAFVVQLRQDKQGIKPEIQKKQNQRGTLIACGLVAGSALMDVFLAIPFSVFQSANILSVVNANWSHIGGGLSVIITVLLGAWIIRRVTS